jgi:CoA:oxalate CoA-transferase
VKQALDGIRVVDFTHVVAGPLATHFLALNGAQVTKIEPPAGDPLRHYTTDPKQVGMAPAFRGINVAKQSVVLDLKSEEGRTAAMRLVREADIVVENFRPGVIKRLGLDYESVRVENPRIIYCSISGFGQTGAMRDVAAIDQIAQSFSGIMKLSGNEGDPAMRIGFPIADTFAGLLAAFAIQTALVQRERGLSDGQYIDLAMLDATLVMLMSVVNPLLATGELPSRTGNRGFSGAPTADTFACASGELTVGAVEEHHVAKLLRVLEMDHLLERPEFADRLSRIRNADAMHEYLSRAFVGRTADLWERELQAAGVPAARVLGVDEAIALPHLADRDLFQVVGGETVLNAGFRFLQGGPGTDQPAPQLGAQTSEINGNHAPAEPRPALERANLQGGTR